MAKIASSSKFYGEKAALHEELINLGFAYVEGFGTYLYEYIENGEEHGIILDSMQTMTFELAVCHLGAEYFNKLNSPTHRLENLNMSQKLMTARLAFFDAPALPKASNQGR